MIGFDETLYEIKCWAFQLLYRYIEIFQKKLKQIQKISLFNNPDYLSVDFFTDFLNKTDGFKFYI